MCVTTDLYSHVQKDVTNFRKLHSDTPVCAGTQIVAAVTGYLEPPDCAPFGITLFENVFSHNLIPIPCRENVCVLSVFVYVLF